SWKKFRYVKCTDTNLAESVTGRIDWRSLDLGEEQQRKLQVRVKEVISYLQAPSIGEYYRLKTEGLHFAYDPSPTPVSWEGAQNLGHFPHAVAEAIADLWERCHSTNEVSSIAGICLDSVAAGLSTTNSVEALVKGKVQKPFTVLKSAMKPAIRYGLTDLWALSDGKNDRHYFDLSAFVEVKPSGM